MTIFTCDGRMVDVVGDVVRLGNRRAVKVMCCGGQDKFFAYVDTLQADGGKAEIKVAVDYWKLKQALVDKGLPADFKLSNWNAAAPYLINDMVIDAMIAMPRAEFYRDELRVKVYELYGYPLSSKQTRDCLYRLRVAGWHVEHCGMGKYRV